MTKWGFAFILVGLGLVGILAFIGFPEISFFMLFWRHGVLLILFLLIVVSLVRFLWWKVRANSLNST